MCRKLIALVLAAVMVFTVSLALAKTVEPEDPEIEKLAGTTVHATVGEYNEFLGTLTVTVFEADRFEKEDIERLAAGDILLAGGRAYTVKEMTTAPDGEPMALTDDGSEIIFDEAGDDEMTARSSDDDRQYMHAVNELYLKAAEGIVYEDDSNPDLDAETIVTEGLEEILKVMAEKEETSIGFHFYSTTVTLNEKLEIVKIHQVFDVAQ